MSNSIESLVRHMIKTNNNDINISFPAVVVNTDKIVDGIVDVQPIVRFLNPLSLETVEYPVLLDVSLVMPSTRTSTFSLPVHQGDFVTILVQSSDVQKFVNGNTDVHDPDFNSFGDLSNVVAIVGFTPYQQSAFNPNNYTNDFNNQNLNIVHNKNTDNEAIISINTDGDISLKSPTKVVVESEVVEVIADSVNANSATISTQGDVEIQGKSVNEFMLKHTHIGNQGSPTSPPSI